MDKKVHRNKGKQRRRAISPVIATVILIAITLIAAVAIGGFVFGLFGSFTSNALVTQAGAVMPDSTQSGATIKTGATNGFTCPVTGSGDYILLKNTGTASTSVSTVSLQFGGSTYILSLSSGTCNIVGSGSANVVLAVNGTASAGETFTGTATLANGAQVPVSGTFT